MSASGHFHDPAGEAAHPVTLDIEAEDAGGHSRHHRRRGTRALITDAIRSPEQNRQSREKRYLFLQGIRLPFIVLCLLSAFAWHNWWLATVFFVVSVPLPWISVMVANGQGEVRDKRQKNVYKPAVAREEQRLEATRRAQLAPGANGADGAAHADKSAPSIIDHEE